MQARSDWPVLAPVDPSVAASVGPHDQAVFCAPVTGTVAAHEGQLAGIGTVDVVGTGDAATADDGTGDAAAADDGVVVPAAELVLVVGLPGAARLPALPEVGAAALEATAAVAAEAVGPGERVTANATVPTATRTAAEPPAHARRRRDLPRVALSRAARWLSSGAGGVGQVDPSDGAVVGPAGVSQPIPVTVCGRAARPAGSVGGPTCIRGVTAASVAWGVPGVANGVAGAVGAGVRTSGRRSAAASCAAVGRAAGSLARQAEISRHSGPETVSGRCGAVCRWP
jgi:hypothetical protein